MNPEIERAMREVLEAWETPDSPEALACAIYQMKRIYMAEVLDHRKRLSQKAQAMLKRMAAKGAKPLPDHIVDKTLRDMFRHNAGSDLPPPSRPKSTKDAIGG
jgi:hypothetical protein